MPANLPRPSMALLTLLLALGMSSRASAWEFNFQEFCEKQAAATEAKLREKKLDAATVEKWQAVRLTIFDAVRHYELEQFPESLSLFQQTVALSETLGEEFGVWLACARIGQGLAHMKLDEREAAMKAWGSADAGLREHVAYAKKLNESVESIEGIRQMTLYFAGLAWMEKREWPEAERCFVTASSVDSTAPNKSDSEFQASLLVALTLCQIKCRKPDEARISLGRAEAICKEFPDECRDWSAIVEGMRKRGW